jgi:hypothetical protein
VVSDRLKAEKPIAPEADGIRGPQTSETAENRTACRSTGRRGRIQICEKVALRAGGTGVKTGLEVRGLAQAIDIEGDNQQQKYERKTRIFSESFVL